MAYTKVDYEKLNTFYKSLGEFKNNIRTTIQSTGGYALNKLISTTKIEGNTAERMRDYLQDVHFTILQLILDIIDRLFEHYMSYINAYLSTVDGQYDSRFSSEEFDTLITNLRNQKSTATSIETSIEGTLRGLSKVFTPATFEGVDEITEKIDKQIKSIKTTNEAIDNIEGGHCSDAFSEIEGMLTLLKQYINENQGNDKIHITTYSTASRSPLCQSIIKCHEIILAEAAVNSADVGKMRDKVLQIGVEQLRDEDKEYYKQAAQKIIILGSIADICVKGIELATISIGIPEPAVKIVGGAVEGALTGGYKNIASQIENYRSGSGALIDDKLYISSVSTGGLKGGASALISLGNEQLFDFIGDQKIVYKLSESKCPFVKHPTNFILEYTEKELTSIGIGVSDAFIDTSAQIIATGKGGMELYKDAVTSYFHDEFVEGGALKTGAETLVGYVIDEKYKSYTNQLYTSPDALEDSHTLGRALYKGGVENGKSILQDFAGEFAEGFVKEGGVEGGVKQMSELITDDSKRAEMIGGAITDAGTGIVEDLGSQVVEQRIIDENRIRNQNAQATGSLQIDSEIPVDKLGSNDYKETSLIYKDKSSSVEAEVEVNTYGTRSYDKLVESANTKYGRRIGDSEFKTPAGYKWTMKFDGKISSDPNRPDLRSYDGKFGSQKVTLQLVKENQLPEKGN